MAFARYVPQSAKKARYGPMRLTVQQAANKATTIRLSAAARDWLRPTPAQHEPSAPAWRQQDPTMRIEMRVDHDNRKLMLIRTLDADTSEHSIAVRGLGSGSGPYITAYDLLGELGLADGRYDCISGEEAGQPYVIIDIDAVLPTQKQQRVETRAKELTPEHQAQQIQQILNTGLDAVNGEPVGTPN